MSANQTSPIFRSQSDRVGDLRSAKYKALAIHHSLVLDLYTILFARYLF